MSPLADLLTRETALVSRFIFLLEQEQSALNTGTTDLLAAINTEKLLLVDQLNQIGSQRIQSTDLSGTATDRSKMANWLKQHPQEKESAVLWVNLLKQAQEAKLLHEMNGKLISLHLQKTSDAISILTCLHKENSLYGSNGQSSSMTGSRIVDSA